MNSFLDKQSLFHKDVDKIVYKEKLVFPEKKVFSDYVSSICNQKINFEPSMLEYFNKIRPDIKPQKVKYMTEQYAKEYCDNLKVVQNNILRFKTKKCHVLSIDLPEMSDKKEIGGRM